MQANTETSLNEAVQNDEKLTPMMRQYFDLKRENKDCILFFRLGDFYEMFFDDALLVSKELKLTLTGRDCGRAERAPMCGVPYHSADGYIGRLVQKGYRVAVCEQTEDPKTTKGLVKREITRIITLGTAFDQKLIEQDSNNYVASVYTGEKLFGIAACDVTTGEFTASCVPAALKPLLNELARLKPKEVITNNLSQYKDDIENIFGITPCVFNEWCYDISNAHITLLNHFGVLNLRGYGIEDDKEIIRASGALIEYLKETQKTALPHIIGIRKHSASKYMELDISSRKNLEITHNIKDGKKYGSLLWVLDKTKTPMGARELRKWLEAPLTSVEKITGRQDAVDELVKNPLIREEIREYLNTMQDMERLTGRLACGAGNARDMSALGASAVNLPFLKELLSGLNAKLFSDMYGSFDILDDIEHIISKHIRDDAPMTIREGGIIKQGASKELDALINIKENGASLIADIEEREREATGIKSLKIRFNKVFGYCIEITNANKDSTPAHYTRRQTLANCERYITDELKKIEEDILSADEKIKALEYDIFLSLREQILSQSERIAKQARCAAVLDCIASLADRADKLGYVRPKVSESGVINIKDGRHPVLEMVMTSQFIPNDTYLDTDDNRLSVITGSNMAGKSTYMRQTAIIALMAQTGSFVPAAAAEIGICDRIFTRVGASDDLLTGQSTFMVEMSEVANILNNATPHSLLILDEIGRGTSTYDGLAIAWACLLHIADKKKLGAKTMFATHYHELTELEQQADGIKNYCVDVKEQDGKIVFLRRVIRGGAGRSFGIEVARLSGIPNSVVRKAASILNALIKADIAKKRIAADIESAAKDTQNEQSETENEVIDTILDLDTDNLTPMDALNKLIELKEKLLN